MTTEDTIFGLRPECICLKNLEERYKNKMLDLDDYVQIFGREGSPSEVLKISTLIKAYGKKYPFRQIPRPCQCDQLTPHFLNKDGELSDKKLSGMLQEENEEKKSEEVREQPLSRVNQNENKTVDADSGKKWYYWATTDYEPCCYDFQVDI